MKFIILGLLIIFSAVANAKTDVNTGSSMPTIILEEPTQRSDYAYLGIPQIWTAPQTFINITIVNMSVVNATGPICLNNLCISDWSAVNTTVAETDPIFMATNSTIARTDKFNFFGKTQYITSNTDGLWSTATGVAIHAQGDQGGILADCAFADDCVGVKIIANEGTQYGLQVYNVNTSGYAMYSQSGMWFIGGKLIVKGNDTEGNIATFQNQQQIAKVANFTMTGGLKLNDSIIAPNIISIGSANLTSSYCGNITGATSNLCTVRANTTSEIFNAVNNNSFIKVGTKVGNTTSEIFNSVMNNSFILSGSKVGNTSAEIFNAVNNNSFSKPGNCPAGQVVQNTTAAGVSCIIPPAGAIGNVTGHFMVNGSLAVNKSAPTSTVDVNGNLSVSLDTYIGGYLYIGSGNYFYPWDGGIAYSSKIEAQSGGIGIGYNSPILLYDRSPNDGDLGIMANTVTFEETVEVDVLGNGNPIVTIKDTSVDAATSTAKIAFNTGGTVIGNILSNYNNGIYKTCIGANGVNSETLCSYKNGDITIPGGNLNITGNIKLSGTIANYDTSSAVSGKDAANGNYSAAASTLVKNNTDILIRNASFTNISIGGIKIWNNGSGLCFGSC